MRITDVRVELFDAVVPRVFRWRAGLPGSGTVNGNAWLIIDTDEGISGRALAARGPLIQDLVDRRLREMLVGHDPLLKEFLWEQAWEIDRIEELPIYALGLADIALWDITAQVAGLPLYKVIGGYRESIPAYASTVTFETTEEFLHVADQCLDYGFKAIKLHAWGDYRKDAKLCQDLRAHVGDEIDLMYDGSAGFDLMESLYVAKALEEANYLWLEEPMREFSIEAYRRLAEAVLIPILSGETSDGAHFNIADFIVRDAADLVRTSTHYKGGITGGLRVAHLAEAFHMRAEVHGGGLPNLHLACAIPNTTYYESLVDAVEIVVEKGIGRDGCISPPDVPGIGWDAAPN
ncbi:MAG: racemase [Thermomicrobiales bacterium]|nr:racemase [Thermomicrobiales bacterium]